jgi:hypothetical protein
MMWVKPAPSSDWTVVVTGDTKGYLSPCGCSDPMSGGIRRRATAVANLKTTKNILILDNGGLVAGQSRQDELKVEALAEALKEMRVDAINLGAEEAKLGMGELLSIQMLSGNKLVCTHLTEPSEAKVKPFIAKGPYLVGGVTTQPELVGAALEVKTIGVDAAVTRLETESVKRKLKPILLFQGQEVSNVGYDRSPKRRRSAGFNAIRR